LTSSRADLTLPATPDGNAPRPISDASAWVPRHRGGPRFLVPIVAGSGCPFPRPDSADTVPAMRIDLTHTMGTVVRHNTE